MVGIMAYPTVWAIWLSFFSRRLGVPSSPFVGLQNYVQLFNDAQFWNAARNTAMFTVIAVALKLVLGMGAASILNSRIPCRNLFRSWMILPWIAPSIVVALTWQWMFADLGGVINHVLQSLHVVTTSISWLGNPVTARFAVVVANVWLGFPFFSMNLLAGMQAIPKELYEAAEVDGASAWRRFWHVTLPGLRSVLVIATVLNTIWTLNTFDLIYVMTGGGPYFATELLGLFAYKQAFLIRNLSYGSAACAIFTPLIAGLIFVVLRRLERAEA
jgi:multiple sugar transport system permease protein